MHLTPEQWRELEAVALPPIPRAPPPPGPRALDDVPATRTHVRILRMLALESTHNFTARGVAQTAEISCSRTLEVVRHLDSLGMLATAVTHTHTIFRLADTHPLRPALTFLYEVESLTPRSA